MAYPQRLTVAEFCRKAYHVDPLFSDKDDVKASHRDIKKAWDNCTRSLAAEGRLDKHGNEYSAAKEPALEFLVRIAYNLLDGEKQ